MDFLKDVAAGVAIEYILIPSLLALIAAGVAWVSMIYNKLSGAKMDEKHRLALQSALENGMRYALQVIFKGKLPEPERIMDQRERLFSVASGYVHNSTPAAVQHFKIGEKRLNDLLVPKLPIFDVNGTEIAAKKPG